MRNAVLLVSFLLCDAALSFAGAPEDVQALVSQHCTDCHSSTAAEGGLNLESLSSDLSDLHTLERWIRIVDRVESGEMPPADSSEMSRKDADRFTRSAGEWIRDHEQTRNAAFGRVNARRLTARQLERTMHALLGIDTPLASLLPEEPRTGGFTTVANGQSFSHFDLANHLVLVDAALDEAFRRVETPADEWSREMPAASIARKNPKRRCREPEMYKGMAVTWSCQLVFYGRIASTTARADGWYQFEFDISTLNTPKHGVWCTVRTGQCTSSAPLMSDVSTFLATEKVKTVKVAAWLNAGEMFEVRPCDSRLKQARVQGGQVGAGECQPQKVPGIGIHKATLSRIHHGPDDKGIQKLLFGGIKLKTDWKGRVVEAKSWAPQKDIRQQMHVFAERAFRRPVSAEIVEPYVELALARLGEGGTLIEALRDGYRAILCSPRFMYLYEEPGELDHFAIASRLSYFLWSSMPDAELLRLAEQQQLRDPNVLRAQVDRMLADGQGANFVPDFAHEWLDLSEIDFTEPSRRMYPGFDLLVQLSMVDETHRFLQHMIDENLSVDHVIDSDFMFLNERLANHYEIAGVRGEELRKVPLTADDPRGGLLTQGAIMKVTANGTNTSPVLRGVWVSERLLGQEIPPPPQSVPAVEPDIRGATTIREQLAKHIDDVNCSSCHQHIDPPGFALENFDPVGKWRSNYRVRVKNRYKNGPKIDPAYSLSDGTEFESIVGFQKVMTDRTPQLARNVASHLITYGTGAPVSFSDRDDVEQIVHQSEASDHGFRSIIHEVVQSDLFLSK